jgi:hypothetical protein
MLNKINESLDSKIQVPNNGLVPDENVPLHLQDIVSASSKAKIIEQ